MRGDALIKRKIRVERFDSLQELESNLERITVGNKGKELFIGLASNPHLWDFPDKKARLDESYLTDNRTISSIPHCSPKPQGSSRYVMVSRASYSVDSTWLDRINQQPKQSNPTRLYRHSG